MLSIHYLNWQLNEGSVLAHPERNRTLGQHPERLRHLVHRGILVQITSGSLTGLYGKEVRAAAEFLSGRDWYILSPQISSDQEAFVSDSRCQERLIRLVGEEGLTRSSCIIRF